MPPNSTLGVASNQQLELKKKLQVLLPGLDVSLPSIPPFLSNDSTHIFLQQQLQQLVDKKQSLLNQYDGELEEELDVQSTDDQDEIGFLSLPRLSEAESLAQAEAEALEQYGHLQQLQVLEKTLTEQLKQQQAQANYSRDRLGREKQLLKSQWGEMKAFNDSLNQNLNEMVECSQEVEKMIANKGNTWLVVAADMREYRRLEEELSRSTNQLMESIGKMSGQLRRRATGEEGDVPTASPAKTHQRKNSNSSQTPSQRSDTSLPDARQSWDQTTPGKGSRTDLKSRCSRSLDHISGAASEMENPWDVSTSKKSTLAENTMSDQKQCTLNELARLRYCYCLGEMEMITSKLKLASNKEKLVTLRRLISEQSSRARDAPWADNDRLLKQRDRVARITQEAEHYLQTVLPRAIDKASTTQDQVFYKCEQYTRVTRQSLAVMMSQVLMKSLLKWASLSKVVDILRMQELHKLQEIYYLIMDTTDLFEEALDASSQRRQGYQRIKQHLSAYSTSSSLSSSQRAARPSLSLTFQSILDDDPMDDDHAVQQQQPVLWFTTELFNMLGIKVGQLGASQTPGRTQDCIRELVGKISQVHADVSQYQLDVARLSMELLPGAITNNIAAAQEAQSLLCQGDTNFKPIVSQPALQDKLAQLDTMNQSLVEKINNIVEANNRLLDPGMNQEKAKALRQSFSMFWTNIQDLLMVAENLHRRVLAVRDRLGPGCTYQVAAELTQDSLERLGVYLEL